jgi:signal transduction histidine kinase
MESKQLFGLAALDALPINIAVIDRHGTIVLVNQAWNEFARANGEPYSAKVSVGANYLDACRAGNGEGEQALEGLQAVLAGRCPLFLLEYPCHSPDQQRWFLMQVAPLKDPVGGAVVAHLDITRRRCAEETLRETSRHKDEFLAVLAHELRSPLTSIRNAVEVLGRTEPADPKLEWARNLIGRQTTHLAHLTEDLLDVSRLGQGRIGLHKEIVELKPIVRQAIEISRPFIDARRHSLAVSIPPEPIWIEGDPTRLVQVVGNLLNNAAKYTLDGGRITLAVDATPSEAVLRVQDNGIGMSAELLPRIFDPFTQADRSLARSEGGLGIGLTLVKRLVELHGGRIRAFSQGPGSGSEFVVSLPRLVSETQAV